MSLLFSSFSALLLLFLFMLHTCEMYALNDSTTIIASINTITINNETNVIDSNGQDDVTSTSRFLKDLSKDKVWKRASLISNSDEYIARNRRQCFETRNLVSCVKYKASKLIWKLATNGLGYFPNEYGREVMEIKRRVSLIQLGEPANDVAVFNDAKSLAGDNEVILFFKFMKRAIETFGRNHALQLSLSGDTGARIVSDADARSRHEKKKRKWLIILPLIILMKIAHLKMTVVTLLLGIMGLNVLLVGGTGWLIHYLKFKTLCKIHPHLVQSHSHVYDSDPADYSQFVGSSSSLSGSPYYSSSGPHEINVNSYNKDWASSKAYHGYNNNYLDTISKRLQ